MKNRLVYLKHSASPKFGHSAKPALPFYFLLDIYYTHAIPQNLAESEPRSEE